MEYQDDIIEDLTKTKIQLERWIALSTNIAYKKKTQTNYL